MSGDNGLRAHVMALPGWNSKRNPQTTRPSTHGTVASATGGLTMFGWGGIVTRTCISQYIAGSLALNKNISSLVWSRKSISVRILRTTGDLDVTSSVSTRYAPALLDSNADMNRIEPSSQRAGT